MEYNDILVTFCKNCLSLDNPSTMEMDGKAISFCKHCGSDKAQKASITQWDRLFKQKYRLGPYLRLNMTWKEIMACDNIDECLEADTYIMQMKHTKK